MRNSLFLYGVRLAAGAAVLCAAALARVVCGIWTGDRDMSEEMVICGCVDKIVFRNRENGYTVLSLANDDMDITCVGMMPMVQEGDYVEAEGALIEHPVYGSQLKVQSIALKEPEDETTMERYLASGAIRGIGPALAKRIVKKFKRDAFRMIEEEPERLAEIKGISERMAREIAAQFEEKKDMRQAAMFLQQYGISNQLGVKIYETYGPGMYEILRENPYQLAEDINGVGFKMADEIAVRAGLSLNSDYRIRAGLLYTLKRASNSGHIYLPKVYLLREASELLHIQSEELEKHLMDLYLDKRVVVKEQEGDAKIYTASFYYMEMNSARMLLDLDIHYEVNEEALRRRIAKIEDITEIRLDEFQEEAVFAAAVHGVLVLTGGPGTGKTTTINSMIKFFESEGMEILLAAPTGRAAKRMSETAGYEAQTIHRLLELKGSSGEDASDSRFERNETNPLETDVVIVDEMSMVDLPLFYALLRALLPGTRLIMAGDVNQLPSVGPGNVLKDIIHSGVFAVAELTKIFRQAAESDIIVNAHRINKGQAIRLDNKSRDFFMLKRPDVNHVISVVIQLIRDKLPRYVQAAVYDIQVLTPMRKGELGVENLNRILQQYLNPPSPDKREKEFSHGMFREGDKVMQIRNNYQIAWEQTGSGGIVVETGAGVFNGDCGIIREINYFAELLKVEYEDSKMVEYRFADAEELELAYAVTVHKAQGSEYEAVVLPLLSGPRLLFNQNILYTAVTRAKKCVTIVGSSELVNSMIQNVNEQKRYTGLTEHIEALRDQSI